MDDWVWNYIMVPSMVLMALGTVVIIWIIVFSAFHDPCPAPNSRIFSHYTRVCSKGCFTVPLYKCITPDGTVIGTVRE